MRPSWSCPPAPAVGNLTCVAGAGHWTNVPLLRLSSWLGLAERVGFGFGFVWGFLQWFVVYLGFGFGGMRVFWVVFFSWCLVHYLGGIFGSPVLLVLPGFVVSSSRRSLNQYVCCKYKVELFYLFLYLFCPLRVSAFLDKKATDDVFV